jgi:endonuclease/exonuclease/phosphatase family metal-dependent hydrolase
MTSPYPFRLLLATPCLFLGFSACTSDRVAAPAPAFTVLSYNIRMDTPRDGINAWPHRKDHVADMIGPKHGADIAGLQEVLRHQLDDLATRLPAYAWVGAGRDDGRDGGEFSPIFYRRDRFAVLDHGTFWLSATPDVPGSKSWDTAITRIVTWARFRDRRDGREFQFFNTHFDHRGVQARLESARLLAARIEAMPAGLPVIVTGDFNVREDSEPYAVMTAVPGLRDSRYISATGHQGLTASTNNWETANAPETRIDYIFVRAGIRVRSHRILDDRYDGRFPSDHMPVIAEVVLGD